MEVTLGYSDADTSHPQKPVRDYGTGEGIDTITGASAPCIVSDARGAACTFDADGFELIDAPTALSTAEFYLDEVVLGTYYAETCEAIRRHLGATVRLNVG